MLLLPYLRNCCVIEFLDRVLWCTNVFRLDGVQLSLCFSSSSSSFFCGSAFAATLKEPLHNQSHQDLHLCFIPRVSQFPRLHLGLWSIFGVHFQTQFQSGLCILSFVCGYSFFPVPFLEEIAHSYIEWPGHPCSVSTIHTSVGLFLTLNSKTVTHMSTVMSVSHFLGLL